MCVTSFGFVVSRTISLCFFMMEMGIGHYILKLVLIFIIPLMINIVLIIVVARWPSYDTPANFLLKNKHREVNNI